MSNRTHYSVEPRYIEGPPVIFDTEEALREHMKRLDYNAKLYTVRTHYTDRPPTTERGNWWTEYHPEPEPEPQCPNPPITLATDLTDDELETALNRYNRAYDNRLYLSACYSVHDYEDDEHEYIRECVAISDVALGICGAQPLAANVPGQITEEMVIFWTRFLSGYVSLSFELPF